jgi:cyclopropane-fatty-acyl-phospholipid synthase
MQYLLEFLLQFFLSRFIRTGSITFTTGDSRSFTCGDGTGEPVAARFVSAAAEHRFLLDPELAFGEIDTDALFVMEKVRSWTRSPSAWRNLT